MAPGGADAGDAAAATSAAVRVVGLGKTFRAPLALGELLRGRIGGRSVEALTDISFTVRPGEVLCLMGPNGAGKSTLLRILAGILLPTRGEAVIAGFDIRRSPAARFRRAVGFVVGEERSFHWPLSGRENLIYFGALHGLSRREAKVRAAELLDRVGLGGAAADRAFSAYSRGMRQRLALARGLLGAPAVLLLDEPTLGLDPVGARDLRRFLRDDVIAAAGRTAIVGTNELAEARALGDRVLLLDRGRLLRETSPDAVEAELGL